MATQAKVQGSGPFGGDERFDYEPRDSDVRMVNWDLMTSVAAAKFHVKELYDKEQEGDEAIVYQLERNNCGGGDNTYADYIDSDGDAATAFKKLLERWDLTELLTQVDVSKFYFLIGKARHHFKVFDHLRQPGLVQHDSSVRSVIEGFPLKWVKWVSYFDVEVLVEEYISVLQRKQYIDLHYKYRLFLADNLSLKAESNLSSMLKKLDESVCFSDEGFGRLKFYDIECGLEYCSYFWTYKEADNAKTHYMKSIKEMYEHEKSCCEKRKKRFPRQFVDPIHFLVFKEREEGYTIQHPLLEITKLRAYFSQTVFSKEELRHGWRVIF